MSPNKFFFRVIGALLLLFFLGSFTATLANEELAKQKFKEKIEKIVVGKILEEIKDKDYDTYRVLSAFWVGLKNQSANAIIRNLRDLLIEKGFIYIIYHNAKEFLRPALTEILLGEDFYTEMQKFNPKYSAAVYKMHGFYADSFAEYNEYFGEEHLSTLRAKLINYFRESKNTAKYFPIEERAKFNVEALGKEMAEKFIKDQEIPFLRNFAFDLPKVKEDFVKRVTNSARKMHEQTLAWYENSTDEREKMAYIWAKERVQEKVFRQILLKNNVTFEEIDAAYLEILSFLIRICIDGNPKSVNNKNISNFANLSKLLARLYPGFNGKKQSFSEITEELNRQMRLHENNEIKYNTFGGLRVFFNTLLWNANALIKEYKSSDSFYQVFSSYNGYYPANYFVNMFFIDYNVPALKSDLKREYAVSGQEFWIFKKQVSFVSIVADDIIKPNKKNMVNTYKRFVMETIKDAPNGIRAFKEKMEEANKLSGSHGSKEENGQVLDLLLGYTLKTESMSTLTNGVENYAVKTTGEKNLGSMEVSKKFYDSLYTGHFKDFPVLRNYLMKIFDTIAQRRDLAALERQLEELDSILFSELIRLGDKKIVRFEYYYELMNYSLPVIGISLKTILKILESKDNQSFEAIVSAGFRQAVSNSIEKLPEDIKKVTEPFLNLAMNAILMGENISMNEYTAVASNIIKALETQTRALYFSLGVGWGSFAITNTIDNIATSSTLSKIFVSDKIGLDFIGLGYDLAGRKVFAPLRFGIFAGGFLDYALSEAVKVDSRLLDGGDHYLKTGVFLAYDNPTHELAKMDISIGMAFNVKGDKSFFVAASWNLFELSDLF